MTVGGSSERLTLSCLLIGMAATGCGTFAVFQFCCAAGELVGAAAAVETLETRALGRVLGLRLATCFCSAGYGSVH